MQARHRNRKPFSKRTVPLLWSTRRKLHLQIRASTKAAIRLIAFWQSPIPHGLPCLTSQCLPVALHFPSGQQRFLPGVRNFVLWTCRRGSNRIMFCTFLASHFVMVRGGLECEKFQETPLLEKARSSFCAQVVRINRMNIPFSFSITTIAVAYRSFNSV